MKKYNFDFSNKTTPLSHQIEATEFIRTNASSALFDEMGLGKSKIVIDALKSELENKNIDCVLVVCKKTLVKNWEEEIQKHTNLPSLILRGSYSEKGTKFMVYSPFYIINYDAVISETKRLSMLMKIKRFAVVLDESHRIKTPTSKTTQAIFSLAPLAVKRIIISGTPVANKPCDLWAQYYFLDAGATLGTDFQKFQKEYEVNLRDNDFNDDKMLRLKNLISNVSIRRLKKDVLQLPEKKYQDIHVKLTGLQKEMYDQLREELYLDIVEMDGTTIADDSENILKRLLRLNQIASNPKLIDHSYNQEPAKYLKLDLLVKGIIAKGEKVIIWSSFVDNIVILKKRYAQYGAVTIYGNMTIEERNKASKKFIEDTDCKILIANPAAAREGLTLTVANNAIYLDRSFNLVDYVQSQDRIHRISQKKECLIVNLIAENTVDAYIDEIIYKKQNVAKFIQGDSDIIMPGRQFLTKQDLLKILGG